VTNLAGPEGPAFLLTGRVALFPTASARIGSPLARAFSGEVDTGSPSENATTQREKSEARFNQNADSL
jgi:hypothetical protein